MKTLSNIVLLSCVFLATTLFSKVVSQNNTSSIGIAENSTMTFANSTPHASSSIVIIASSSIAAVNSASSTENVNVVASSISVNSISAKTTSAAVNLQVQPASSTGNVGAEATSVSVNPASSAGNVGASGETTSLTSLPENTAASNVQQTSVWATATQSKHAQTSQPQPESSSHAAAMTSNIVPAQSKAAGPQSSSVSSNTLSCYYCKYNQTGHCEKKSKKCNSDGKYCIDYNFKLKNGDQSIGKDCAVEEYCKDGVSSDDACRYHNKTQEINGAIKDKECSFTCCKTNLCNDNFSEASFISFQFACWMIILVSLCFVT